MSAAPIADHIWQSTVVAAVLWLLTFAFRSHRAHVRYGLWLAASLKFLVPFALLVSAGAQVGWRTVPIAAPPRVALVVETLGQPFTAPAGSIAAMALPVAARAEPSTGLTTAILAAAWIAGVLVLLAVWCARWRRIARIVRDAQPEDHGPVLATLRRLEAAAVFRRSLPLVVSDSLIEPGVFGILRPVVVWPRRISQHLDEAQVGTVLAHELAHVRRRDNLAAAGHMVVQAVFWFHPLVWWIGSRLVDERERACDEAVVEMGSDPQTYAEGILRTCQWYVGTPLACVAGVTGSNLRTRIEHIMASDAPAALGRRTKALLGAAGVAAVVVPVIAGMLNAPLRAQAPDRAAGVSAFADTRAELDRRVAEMKSAIEDLQQAHDRAVRAYQELGAQPGTGAVSREPAFEVASVKPNTSGDGRVLMMPQPGGRLNLVNVALRMMIRNAYRVQDFQIVGGPDWMGTARYDVMAKAGGGNPSQDELQLMMRSLLADRFKLVVHTEQREMPIYALVPARADGRLGAQLKKSDADCRASAPAAPLAPGQVPRCGLMVGFGNLRARGATLPAFAATLSTFAGRVVVDRTNIAGGYDIDLTWTPDQIPRAAGGGDQPVQVNGAAIDPNGPSLFTGLQEQLGLKLESTKGPVDVLVVDRAEKPTED